MKSLSLDLPAPPEPPRRPRRPSVLSLPDTAVPVDEDRSPSVPYASGPVQVLPRIWLGSEDNARDWHALHARGIAAVLNVAKEVPPPSARPAMHYLKLHWSHGQRDLVTHGFPTAMAFVDAALQRNQGILIHCQCGVSRSATLVIAIVMRAAASRSPNVPPDVWELKGMQAAYSFVKDKSRHVGPNMSLIYQLQDYEKALQGCPTLSVSSDLPSSVTEEDKEWGRRRNAFEQEAEFNPIQQEAFALDRAMEERVVARRPSTSSTAPASRSRYGRKRTGSIASIHTTASVLSEDLVEADEESELLGVGGPFDDVVLEPRRSPSLSSDSPGSPNETNPGSYPRRLSFSASRPPANLNFKIAPGKAKRRPLPLGTLPPVPPSPSTPVAVQESKPSPRRRKHFSRKQAPPPLKLQGGLSSIAFPTDIPPSKYPVSALPSQTLFVFPPSPTVTPTTAMRKPATMTITSNVNNNTCPFPSQTTPRVATSRSHGRTRSFIGLGTSVAPTTAYSRVDARGWVGLE